MSDTSISDLDEDAAAYVAIERLLLGVVQCVITNWQHADYVSPEPFWDRGMLTVFVHRVGPVTVEQLEESLQERFRVATSSIVVVCNQDRKMSIRFNFKVPSSWARNQLIR